MPVNVLCSDPLTFHVPALYYSRKGTDHISSTAVIVDVLSHYHFPTIIAACFNCIATFLVVFITLSQFTLPATAFPTLITKNHQTENFRTFVLDVLIDF